MDPSAPSSGSERFRLGPLLGSGGMGKVYRAHDLALHRPVALKFLRSSEPRLRERFLREARSQARVDHPHVCKVYEVGEIDGIPYIAMQLIEGRTLHEERPLLSQREKVEVARAVALGIHEAHLRGLVHRDLKPANILVGRDSDGRPHPYVTDFGLAHDQDGPGDTLAGAILGTPQYMAPEQARGEHDRLGARTDVYALGALLYELLAGEPPLSGATTLTTLYKLANEQPRELRRRVPEVGAALSAVVMRCLEKRAERRYPTAKALADDLGAVLAGQPITQRAAAPLERFGRLLRRAPALPAALGAALATGAVALLVSQQRPAQAAQAPLLAVADFVDQTGEQGFGGLSSLLVTALEQSRHVRVLTRTRTVDLLRARGHASVDLLDEQLTREAAQTAGATALALGKLSRFDRLYTLELALVDPRSGEALASTKAEGRGRESIPGLVDQVADQARRALREQADVPARPVAAVTTDNLEAWQRYFQGEQELERGRASAAVAHYQGALQLDPGFAMAWYRLGYTYMWMHDGPRMYGAAEKAWSLSARLPEKERLQIQALRALTSDRGAEALSAWSECLARYPQEKECAFNVGDLLFHGGEIERSIPAFEQALALDGAMERTLTHLCWAYQILERQQDLLRVARQYQQRVGSADAWGVLGRTLAATGDYQAARETVLHTAQLFPQSPGPRADLAVLAAATGKLDEAHQALRPLLADERAAEERWLGLQTQGYLDLYEGRVATAAESFEKAALEGRLARSPMAEMNALAALALVELLYREGPAAALRVARSAVARGVPEAYFAYVYPFAGALDDYERVLRKLGDPLAPIEVGAFAARARGDASAAEQLFARLARSSPYQEFTLYVLAQAQAEQGHAAAAAATLATALNRMPDVISPGIGFGGVFHARGDLVLSRLLEQAGDARGAIEHASRFQRAWANADQGRPEPAEARERIARLGGAGGPR
jgi:tetratricopeptide (TPR) repeat protein